MDSNKLTAVIPPIPVFSYVDRPEPETGIVLRRIFPCEGVITRAAMYIENYIRKEELTVELHLFGPLGGSFVNNVTTEKLITIAPNLPVHAGNRLAMALKPADLVEGIWMSFLYRLPFREAAQESFVFDELIALTEKSNAKENGATFEASGYEEGT
jgi:hypothetical protein